MRTFIKKGVEDIENTKNIKNIEAECIILNSNNYFEYNYDHNTLLISKYFIF